MTFFPIVIKFEEDPFGRVIFLNEFVIDSCNPKIKNYFLIINKLIIIV